MNGYIEIIVKNRLLLYWSFCYYLNFMIKEQEDPKLLRTFKGHKD
jgi:hypothetical protein